MAAASTSVPEMRNQTPVMNTTCNNQQAINADQTTSRTENESVADKSTLLAVLQFLKKHNLKGTEQILKQEANLLDSSTDVTQTDSDVSNVLSTYKSEGDPDIYDETYTNLKKFIASALDMYKHELSMILYPVFVHMYLELIYNQHENQAKRFMDRFGKEQEAYYEDDIRKLATVVKMEHMKGSELISNFRSSQFTVRMSRDSYAFLKKHLSEKKQHVLLNIIQEHLYLDVYEGITRSKQQVNATAGAMGGEALRQANKVKVYYGLLKEPELHVPMEEDDETGETKKKKPKKDPMLSKKSKNDPNAPPVTRIPIPDLRDADKLDKIQAMRESVKRVKLGPDSLPSIGLYTFINSHQSVSTACISEDTNLMAAGFSDSIVKVWSLSSNKLKRMKSAQELSLIDKEADDVLVRMMDEKSGVDSWTLSGHSGPVYSTAFSHDRNYLLSCSEDATIRLWSLLTWTNLVCYKGHNYPVWDAKFSPHGYYFASCGHDKTARLWATDHHQALRIFVGHVSDVDCIQFHPNSNYIATGSSDRSIRLWDVLTGNCVRHMTGHKGTVSALTFSNDGRFLASGGTDNKILIWDLAHGHLLSELRGHCNTVHSLAFSRDGTLLASGGNDYSVKLWDVVKMFEEIDLEDLNISHTPVVNASSDDVLVASYPTKSTSLISLHFSRRNLLLATGVF